MSCLPIAILNLQMSLCQICLASTRLIPCILVLSITGYFVVLTTVVHYEILFQIICTLVTNSPPAYYGMFEILYHPLIPKF